MQFSGLYFHLRWTEKATAEVAGAQRARTEVGMRPWAAAHDRLVLRV